MAQQSEYQEVLTFAISLAQQGGEVIRQAFDGQGLALNARVKADNPSDLVTAVDEYVETLVFGKIKERFPTHCLIGEETASGQPWKLTTDPTWIVDPVDGTTNFAQGFPFVAISIAFAVDRELVVGVVYNPILDELYSACQGHGAWLNQTRRLPLPSGVPKPLPPLSQCLFGFEHGSDRTHSVLSSRLGSLARLLEKTENGGAQVRGMRCVGSGALDMCLVARGSLDLYWEIGSHLWDIAAGTVIVREAGGMVVNGQGAFANPQAGIPKEPVDELAFDLMGRKYLAIRAAGSDPSADPTLGRTSMRQLASDALQYLEDIQVTRDGDPEN
ncbi:hypothetical protein IWQ62_001442 [Dispira parvispora]|uniref:Inositol-1-monophosphatase n=1 Tax=Dispira parvispora TaxID=1520584 RepID=A0A9W8ASC3_9FUNG|nr:hypothetical protein IWQ62_001442 [Dispira parvispora]